MRRITLPAVAGVAVTLLFALPATVIHSRAQAPQQAVPQDLTPLLAKPTSEMRLVVAEADALVAAERQVRRQLRRLQPRCRSRRRDSRA